jgi:hypothetical protein
LKAPEAAVPRQMRKVALAMGYFISSMICLR